jgi:hypothetical protein
MSNNGGPSASKNSIPPLYYPLDPASSSIPRDPIPHPDSNSYTSTGNPLPRGGDTQGLVDSREAERKKQAEPAMAQKEQEKWMKLEKEREPRMMTREQRLKEREARRILHEEELANLSEDSEKLETGQGRLSKRHLKAEIERKKQVLEELAGEEDWIFDCICGAYGQIDDGTHSIACDKCNIWQHSKCVGVSQAEADREDFHFICTRCQRRAKDAERAKNQPPIKLQVEKQVGTKRPLSKSDIHQNERAPKSPFISDIAPPKFFSLGKERHPQTANVPEQPMVFGLRGPNHATIRTEDDSDDEGKEEMDWQRDWIPVQEDSIIPNYEGFKSHALRLNPEMDPRNKWLVSRIAHQQEIRYKNLLDLRVRHSQAILRRDCGAGPNCLASGGSATFLDRKGNAVENVTQASDHGPLRLVTDFEDRDSDLEEGTIIEDLFPQGVPMPPTRKLPAEFECQLCFKVKKFIRPSDWTKHVHEDIQPFTCTFDKCKEPRSFKRKADWVCHENERHRHLEWWICQVEDCRHPCYRKTNFIQHLVREHKMPEVWQNFSSCACLCL